MELNITELRQQGRPLWMTELDVENFADLIGGGGDIWTDRLPLEWERHTGMELTQEEISQIPESELSTEGYSSMHAESGAESGIGVSANVSADVNVSGVEETVSDVTGTVKDTVSGVTGAVGGILGGAVKKAKKSVNK